VADATRSRIISAALRILAKEGREGMTTRAVADAAEVQAPAIYRLFGDKRGLLDAVVALGVEKYYAAKAARASGSDPLDDLRQGWDQHVAFGLANPAIYALMIDPQLALPSAFAGLVHLEALVHRAALAGRLRVGEAQAVAMIHAAGQGCVLSLLQAPDDELSAAMREAVIAAITSAAPRAKPSAKSAAIALRAALPELAMLTPAERGLLDDWLARVSGAQIPE